MSERGGSPANIAEAIQSFLSTSGLASRVEQAEIVTAWSRVVGQQIASVTEALSITPDGTLHVRVRSNAWMTELSLREPEILKVIRTRVPGQNVKRIRWRLWTD